MKARFSVGVLMNSLRSIHALFVLLFSLIFLVFVVKAGPLVYQVYAVRNSYLLVISVALCLTVVASFALVIGVLLTSFGSSREQASDEARV